MSDTSTRSGMLWEVERILQECKDIGTLPEILMMENVPQIHSTDNLNDFNKWKLRLEELGYQNYFQDLIATDYGIPQTRNRCFMVSLLGDYSYTFPRPIPLKLKLKDMLEDNVDEKYYLSDKQIKDIQSWNAYEKPLENMERTDKSNISPTLTTRSGAYAAGMVLIKDTENYVEWEDDKNIQMNCRAWKEDKVCATLNTGGDTKILIKNATSKGYLEAEDGDGIDISSRMEYHRGTVQKDKAQTLTTQCDRGVVVNMKTELCNNLIKDGKVKENDVIRHSYTSSRNKDWNKRSIEQNNLSPTLDTRCDCLGVCVGTYQYSKSDKFMNGKDRLQLGKEVSDTLQTTQKEGVVTTQCDRDEILNNINKNAKHQQDIVQDSNGNARTLVCGTHGNGGHYTKTLMSNLRIRKLTPRECGRLMGVKDEDITNLLKNQSDSSAYHLFGDSIVVNVIEAIIKQML